jgi:hypothetical protein
MGVAVPAASISIAVPTLRTVVADDVAEMEPER